MNIEKSTTKKLLASPIPVLILGVLVIAINLLWFLPARSSLRSGISNVERSTVKLAITQIDSFLEARKLEVEIPANYINQNLNSKENDLILKKITKNQYIMNVSLSNTDGDEILKYDKYKTMFAGDMQSILDKKGFKEAVKSKEVTWSNVAFPTGTEPTITVNIPVLSVIGDVIGVLSAEFKINSIFSAISSIGINENAQAYIVDSSGILVSGRDLSLVLKNTSYLDRKIVKDTIGTQDNSVVYSDNNTYSYVNEKGVNVLAVGERVSKTGWAVIFEEQKGSAYTNITKLSIFALSSTILFILMIIFLRDIYFRVVLTGIKLQESLSEQKELFKEAEESKIKLQESLSEQKELFKEAEESKKYSEEASKLLQEKDRSLVEKVTELENFQKFVVDREVRMVELKDEIVELKSKLSQSNT